MHSKPGTSKNSSALPSNPAIQPFRRSLRYDFRRALGQTVLHTSGRNSPKISRGGQAGGVMLSALATFAINGYSSGKAGAADGERTRDRFAKRQRHL